MGDMPFKLQLIIIKNEERPRKIQSWKANFKTTNVLSFVNIVTLMGQKWESTYVVDFDRKNKNAYAVGFDQGFK